MKCNEQLVIVFATAEIVSVIAVVSRSICRTTNTLPNRACATMLTLMAYRQAQIFMPRRSSTLFPDDCRDVCDLVNSHKSIKCRVEELLILAT